MAIDEKTKRRLLDLKDTLLVAQWLKEDAHDNVIMCTTITDYGISIIHRLGHDSDAFNVSSITRIATKLGIEIRPTPQKTLVDAFTRIVSLEDALTVALARIEALEELATRHTEVGAVGQDNGRAWATAR